MPYNNHKDWEDAKDLFKEVTGKSKPDAGFLKHRSGLSNTLKDLDEYGNTSAWQVDMKKYEKTIASFNKKADSYVKLLDKQIDKEKTKDEKTRKRALKALKAKLEKYQVIYDNDLDSKKTVNEGVDILEQLQRGLAKALKVGVTNCGAALKTIKSSPTPEVYNKEMQKGARSLTTALKRFEQIKDRKTQAALASNEEYQQSDISKFWMEMANGHQTSLDAWADGRGANGDKTRVADDATKQEIIAEVKAVSDILKRIAADFRKLLV